MSFNLEVGKRIKNARLVAGLSLKELGEKIELSEGNVQRYEAGKIKGVDVNILKKIASALNCTEAYLMGWEEEKTFDENAPTQRLDIFQIPGIKNNLVQINDSVKIPVLGEVAAGIPIFAAENYIDTIEISPELASNGEYFALYIKGDSMMPKISQGDLVVVRHQDYAENGDIVIALVDGDSATCKQFFKHTESISLNSFNPAYAPMVFSKEEVETLPVQIIGKVVESRTKF